MSQQSPAYYTDDITLMSAGAIWRLVAKAGVLAPFLFIRFYIRKLLRLPYPATYGTPYPDSLPLRSIEQLPQGAREAFAQRFGEFDASGLRLAFCTVTPFIGSKWGASAIFLSQEGDVYASAVWVRIKLNTFDRAETIVSCHSLLSSGQTLTTGAIPANRWLPEMIPTAVTMTRLPETAPLSEVLRAHREKLRSVTTPLVRLDEQTVQQQMLSVMKSLYDHLIAKNLYRRLSDKEVNRLISIAQPV